jgi:hypothetical protein
MGVGLLASLLGFKFFARSGFFGNSWNTSMKYTLSFFLISLIQIFILPIIIDKISKTFKSESNIEKSKTFTYVALVPFFLSLILFIKPNIGNNVAPFVALYSFYLFYTAAPILKKTPKENLIPYVVSIIVVDLSTKTEDLRNIWLELGIALAIAQIKGKENIYLIAKIERHISLPLHWPNSM